jgi:hypothetical protein
MTSPGAPVARDELEQQADGGVAAMIQRVDDDPPWL